MKDEDLHEINEMIAVKLCPAIDELFRSKGINAKRTGAHTDENFLYLDLLVDMEKTDLIIRVDMKLDKNTLYSRGCCSILDAKAGADKNKLGIANLVKLRILRIVFEVCKAIKDGLRPISKDRTKVYVSFANKSGNLWYV